MEFNLTLFGSPINLFLPQGLAGWALWLGLLLLLILSLWRARAMNAKWRSSSLSGFVFLAFLTPFATLLLGFHLTKGGLPLPNAPFVPSGPAVMIFSALPWVLAAGFLGPLAAALLAGFSGLLLAGFDTYNAFTPLIYALSAVIFSTATRQTYRTLTYRILRRPLVAGSLISLLFPFLFTLTMPFLFGAQEQARLNYALSWVGVSWLAFILQVFFSSAIAEMIAIIWPQGWFKETRLEPSPAERSLEARILSMLAPWALGLMVLLVAGDWMVAEDTAQTMIQDRMGQTVESVSNAVPFVMETGQSLIMQIAEDQRLYTISDRESLNTLLAGHLRAVPFFDQLSLLSLSGASLAGYPTEDFNSIFPTQEEQLGLQLARQGVSFQSYTIGRYDDSGRAGRISFIAVIANEIGEPQGIILGRTSLETNPFTTPWLETLDSLTVDYDGVGILLDENDMVLYHPDSNLIGQPYTIEIDPEEPFSIQISPRGIAQMVYAQPVRGRAWTVITTVPTYITQRTALAIAAPLAGLLLLLAAVAYIILRFGIRGITGTIQQLTMESGRIATGNLNNPLTIKGVDEVGRLGQSFEIMRLSIKTQLDEINRLLSVSTGVAAAMDMETAVNPILEGALSTGATSARVVLAAAALPEYEQDIRTRFGAGPSAKKFQNFDAQVLALTEKQDQVVLTNAARALQPEASGQAPPTSLSAIAMRHEQTHYGCLWVAYDQPHQFSEEELRFIGTVAGQASLAAANARLYMTALLGRQRLESILASSPDPVLVTDHNDKVLLLNPAAEKLFAGRSGPLVGAPITEIIAQKELLELLQTRDSEQQSVEVNFEQRVFYATASPVLAEDMMMGRVCVLNDITYFKELDALKSEFVSTVSHDLRSPLTLMRGYATMLQMVGDLNDQQTGYVGKIVTGVESMSRLVNNLLDLGRIEAGVGLQPEMVPVYDIVRQVTEALQIQAAQKQIEMEVDLPQHTMPVIEADQALLQQAVHNLVENAIKYTEPGGRVHVGVALQPENILFAVRDTGIGISPVDVPHLFERFFRAAGRETRKQRGSGLGLAIVKSIAEKHGGSVRVESKLGQGSTFFLTIPLRQPKEED